MGVLGCLTTFVGRGRARKRPRWPQKVNLPKEGTSPQHLLQPGARAAAPPQQAPPTNSSTVHTQSGRAFSLCSPFSRSSECRRDKFLTADVPGQLVKPPSPRTAGLQTVWTHPLSWTEEFEALRGAMSSPRLTTAGPCRALRTQISHFYSSRILFPSWLLE